MWRSLVALMVAGPALAQPQFAPVEVPSHSYTGGWEHFVGGGLAVFDCDGDARPELFAAGGDSPATLLRNTSAPGGALSFADATPQELALTGVTGAYPIDLDGDALTDLVVLRAGPNAVLRGLGECAFETWQVLPDLGDRWTTAFSAIWETGQTRPTLAFGHYVDRSDPDGPFEACDIGHLLRPDGAGYAVTELTPAHCPLSMLFSDWGRQGRADLRVSNDRHYYVRGGAEQMWAMEDTPRLMGPEDGWVRHELWGMGIAARDVTGDGRQEVYLSSMGDQRLQQWMGGDQPEFRDVPFDWGTTTHRPPFGGDGRPSTGWHVAFGDVTNDGRDDIFVTKGNVDQMPGLAMEDPNALLEQSEPGRWSDVTEGAGLASFHRGRGGALVDLNGDGLLDVVVVNRRAPLEVWQNVSQPQGTWVGIDLVGPPGNSAGIGAWIELRSEAGLIVREVTLGGGHAGGALVPQHFGPGDVSQVEARVVWPDGITSPWRRITLNGVTRMSR